LLGHPREDAGALLDLAQQQRPPSELMCPPSNRAITARRPRP
jgi:hypothetical protein